jgi:hypothetical protein
MEPLAVAATAAASRLQQTNEKAFAALDRVLATSAERVSSVQKRVENAETTTTEIAQNLRDWTTTKAKERLVLQHAIENRVTKLDFVLQRRYPDRSRLSRPGSFRDMHPSHRR